MQIVLVMHCITQYKHRIVFAGVLVVSSSRRILSLHGTQNPTFVHAALLPRNDCNIHPTIQV
jgi:hypothetical protein